MLKYKVVFYLLFLSISISFCDDSCSRNYGHVECDSINNLVQYSADREIHNITVKAKQRQSDVFNCDKPFFEKFKNVKYLTIVHAGVLLISKDCFRGMTDLIEVDFNSNVIPTINLEVFETSTEIERIVLNENHIATLDFGNISLPKLTHLEANNNQIRDISMTSDKFPELTTLSIISNQITHFKINSQSLTFLNLDYNLIDNFTSEDLITPNLEFLHMRENKLKAIFPEMMKNVRNIRDLGFEKNSLRTFSLQDTQVKNYINLRNNKITKLEEVKIIFDRDFTDYKIDFSNNNISRLTGIPQIWGVKTLFCVKCSIDFVEPFLFANAFNQTKFLIISYNNLNTANIFQTDGTDLQFLEIDLSSNQIAKIESMDFRKLKHIETIRLKDNKITTIEPGAFNGLTLLRVLNLGYNLIYRLPIDLFSPLVNMKYLAVEANNLAYFQLTYDVFKNLILLEIYDNPLQCKCLEMIRSYTKTHGIKFVNDKLGKIKNRIQPECIINDICDPEAGEEFVKDLWQLFNNRKYIQDDVD
ncbi:hypothetical protein DMENIID0001_149700 [Sergentomyia squamirostris]